MCNNWKVKVIHRFKTHKRESYKVVLVKNLTDEGEPMLGLCDEPNPEEIVLLRLNQDMSDYQLMETIIHEMAHAHFWDKSETNVNRFAKATMSLLRRLGYLPAANDRSRFRSF